MGKTLQNLYRTDKRPYKVPKKVQDVIPVKRIYADGIFETDTRFTKSWKFTDINYFVASKADKQAMLLKYCDLLNSLDPSITTKITINNRRARKEELEKAILAARKNNELDYLVDEYNRIMMDKALRANGIIQEKYITVSVAEKSVEQARAAFRRIGADLSHYLSALGSRCMEMETIERLRVLHDFYRSGEESSFFLDVKETIRRGHDFRDNICPDSMERGSDYLMIGERYARVFYLKDYANSLKDKFISDLTGISANLMLSIDIVTVPTDEAIRDVERKLLGVETNITNWQRKQNRNNNFSAIVPYDMEMQRAESKEFLDDICRRDQRMMYGLITLVITADTKKELENDTKIVRSIAQRHMCQMAVLKYQQMDGLNTVLPAGDRRIDTLRTLTTESLAAFIPFWVPEIMNPGGIYYGVNAISGNLILINKDELMNPSSWILGVPGSGKSMLAKLLAFITILLTDDDIIIVDPEGEYVPMIQALGDIASIIRIAAGGRDRLNAMYMVEGYGENDPVVVKSEFIMSLIERIDKNGVGPQQKSIIDRCIGAVYREAKETGVLPTLTTLREKLLAQPEPEARDIALSMELYTEGSLDIFGKQSNVDMNKRIVLFDTHGLNAQLKPAGMLVITDTILNRVTLNWKKGKRTHVIIDEVHTVFENEYSAQFFNSAWRQFRKRNACPTAITQNVEYLLDSVQASTMLSNSELIVMLNQAAGDREELARLLNISEDQTSYIENAEKGCGLIRCGKDIIPFNNIWPKGEIYDLVTTKPKEGMFAAQALFMEEDPDIDLIEWDELPVEVPRQPEPRPRMPGTRKRTMVKGGNS